LPTIKSTIELGSFRDYIDEKEDDDEDSPSEIKLHVA